ncbi:MAG: hypothetical protein PHY47_01745 [Lachnospiraceae bacterium]|nr:hypothetical protein [Lachnospiraceae bacterium]
MNGKIILHIGTPKTATSALQTFFVQNRNELKKHGIYYPAFNSQSRNIVKLSNPLASFNGNGTMLRFSFTKKYDSFSLKSKRIFHKIVNSTKKYPYVIISAEDFFDMGTKDFYENFLNSNCKLEVVCYLRRQDEYYESLWGYFVKTYSDFNYKCIDFCKSTEIKSHYTLDYYKKLTEISDIIGADHVHVRSFNHLNVNIYQDFFDTIKADWSDEYRIPEGIINEKLSLEMLEIKRRINELSLKNKALINESISKIQQKYSVTTKGSYLSNEEKKSICDYYKDGNDKIIDEFLNGETLFSYEYTAKKFTPDDNYIQELYTETLCEITKSYDETLKTKLNPSGLFLFIDKVKRTFRKYAINFHLIDERYANEFTRKINYKNTYSDK